MLNTKIEWTHHTVNFYWGCSKVSPACENCYAEALDKRYHGGVNWHGQRMPRLEKAREECLKLERRAVKTGERILCFVESMGDWLDPDVPVEWLAYLLDTIRICPHVTFQLLTKRPELWRERITKSMEFGILFDPPTSDEGDFINWLDGWLCGEPPANVWIGCTVENQEMADKRIPELLKIPARVRFLSCEPLLGPVNLRSVAYIRAGGQTIIDTLTGHMPNAFSGTKPIWARIDWIICGGESGPKARPMHPDWARGLRDQCKADGVPFFFKQWGEWAHTSQARYDQTIQTAYEEISDAQIAGSLADGKFIRGTDSYGWMHVGKARAGHLLDGVEHHEFPRVESKASHE